MRTLRRMKQHFRLRLPTVYFTFLRNNLTKPKLAFNSRGTEVGLDFLIPIAEITVTCSPDPLSFSDTREQTRGFTHARPSVLLLSHLVSSRSNIPPATLSALPYMECMIITGTFLLGGLHCGQPYRISFCEHSKNLQVCLEFTVVT